MRYLTCNKKGCGRTFEGNLALSIHQGRKHKNVPVNGKDNSRSNRLNGETTQPVLAPLTLTDEGGTISAITTMLDSLSTVGLGYVTVRAQARFAELKNQGGTSE